MKLTQEEGEAAILFLRRLMDELPEKRDWLDPDLEKGAKNLLKQVEERNK